MRTLSKGNYGSYMTGKGRKHEHDCRLQEEPGRHVIPNQ
jgi:hypothetical protein